MGFSRQEYWSGLPCPPPGHLPSPGIELTSLTFPVLAGTFFTIEPPGIGCINQYVEEKVKFREENYRICGYQVAPGSNNSNSFSHLLRTHLLTCPVHFTVIHLHKSQNHSLRSLPILCSFLDIKKPRIGKWSTFCKVIQLKDCCFGVCLIFWKGGWENIQLVEREPYRGSLKNHDLGNSLVV